MLITRGQLAEGRSPVSAHRRKLRHDLRVPFLAALFVRIHTRNDARELYPFVGEFGAELVDRVLDASQTIGDGVKAEHTSSYRRAAG
jgi:hypothetical protein